LIAALSIALKERIVRAAIELVCQMTKLIVEAITVTLGRNVQAARHAFQKTIRIVVRKAK
jgi:hypothetical protein